MDREEAQKKIGEIMQQVEPEDAVAALMQAVVDVTDDAAGKYRLALRALVNLADADSDAIGLPELATLKERLEAALAEAEEFFSGYGSKDPA